MQYLEDFLELIEHLPSSVKEDLNSTAKKDADINAALEKTETRVQEFFKDSPNMSIEWQDKEKRTIRQAYSKLVQDSEEKVKIVSSLQDQAEKILKKLESELEKFKMELESDSPGITETIERNSTSEEMESSWENFRKRTAHFNNDLLRDAVLPSGNRTGRDPEPGGSQRVRRSTNSSASAPITPNSLGRHPSTSLHSERPSTPISNRAQALLSSQAQTSTYNLSQRRLAGHTSSSVRHSIPVNQDSSIPLSVGHPSGSLPTRRALEESQLPVPSPKIRKRKIPSGADTNHTSDSNPSEPATKSAPRPPAGVDPDEPKYCVCNQVSYGSMVACDHAECTLEWFHYACVGLTEAPRGRWYCPTCRDSVKKKKHK